MIFIKEKRAIINIQNKNYTNVLKLFAINDTREINKNEFMISFNENQIEFSSTPIPDSTLDLERKYKTLLNKRSGNNTNISPIANRLRSGTSKN